MEEEEEEEEEGDEEEEVVKEEEEEEEDPFLIHRRTNVPGLYLGGADLHYTFRV